MNWKWPQTAVNDFYPWYTIAWHAIWVIPYYVTRILFVAIVAASNLSLRQAGLAWDETR